MSSSPVSSTAWSQAPAELVWAYQAAHRSLLQALRQSATAASDGWACSLHLGAQHTWLAVGADREAPALLLTLPLGSAKTAQDFFFTRRQDGAAHAYPTPLALENAIAVVEDDVYAAHAQLRGVLPPGLPLQPWSCSPVLQELATLAGVASGAQWVLDKEAMEALFNRVAAVAEGRPAAHAGLPEQAPWAAALLVLRELMHHLPAERVTLVARSAE